MLVTSDLTKLFFSFLTFSFFLSFLHLNYLSSYFFLPVYLFFFVVCSILFLSIINLLRFLYGIVLRMSWTSFETRWPLPSLFLVAIGLYRQLYKAKSFIEKYIISISRQNRRFVTEACYHRLLLLQTGGRSVLRCLLAWPPFHGQIGAGLPCSYSLLCRSQMKLSV